ncbi:MAG TPA: right-handed parallel beta-helix repeat-containing protein [Verrucomicrobiae bacterium]|nr:right-handed parallel beta-helix repeat-containing protein [Verrucomicrobiae bacterium]
MNRAVAITFITCLALGSDIAATSSSGLNTTQAFLAPEGFVLRGTGGTPTGTYFVVSATDLTTSISNWVAIATNQFDSSGNFDCTNAVSPINGQQFYAMHVVQASTNPPSLQIIQAEDGTFTGSVANNHAGYTGVGFVDTDNAVGSYIEVEFGRQHGGTETMYVRYAHGKSDDRTASVTVNGSVVTSSVDFPPTGDFTVWQYVTNAIPVVVGKNVVRLTALTSGGLANIDRFEITGDPQYKLSVGVNGNGTVTLNPSNASSYYDPGTTVTLTAAALTGSVFSVWSGDLTSSNNPETLLVDSNKSVTANFTAFLHFPMYVSPSGNDANPGTIDQPFYSLSTAVSRAVAGDTIYMRGGTFSYTATVLLDKAGTASNLISILAYPGEHPVLDYSAWVPSNETIRSGARGIHITTNAQYWVLTGLDIGHAPDNGVKCEGGHITFDTCVFHHNGDTGLQIGLNKDTLSSNPDPEHAAAYNFVLNCDAYRNADPATGYENADGIDCKLYAGVSNRLYGCRSWENSDDGYDCYQTDYEIVFQNCWSWHNGDPALFGNPSSFSGDGNGFKLGGDSTYCPMLVENCVALNCQWGTTVGFAYNDNTAPITLYNCSALTCGRSYNLQQPDNALANCLDLAATRPAPKDISSTSTQQNNAWNLGIKVTTNDFVSISETDAAAPRQADGSLPNNGFAKLQSTSDLIDKGVNVGLPFYGSAPDLGAYEFNPGP